MYDEFERAVTGKSRKGLPLLAWVGIALGLFFVLGVVGVGFAAYRVASHVEEFVEEFEGSPAMMAAEMLSEMEPAMEILAADPEMTRNIVRSLQEEDWVGWQKLEKWEGWEEEAADQLDGSFRFRTEEGEVTAQLKGGEDGGFLVVRSPEGQVRFDLIKGDEGGELLIRTQEETIRLGAGEAAEAMPGWVPRAKGMPDDLRRVFSATSGKGQLGAVAWETDRSPEAILEFYKQRLESDGYELQAEHSAHNPRHRSESFWGKNEAEKRLVFVAASRKRGLTKVILGYGERLD